MKRTFIRNFFVVCLLLSLGLVWYHFQYPPYGYGFTTTSSGLAYKAIGGKGQGRKVQASEWVDVSLVLKVGQRKGHSLWPNNQEKERILLDSSEGPQPCLLSLSALASHKVLTEMLNIMEEGQSMLFKCSIPYYLGEENPEKLDKILKELNLQKEDQFIISITLNKIMTNAEHLALVVAQQEAQLTKDKALITAYLKTHQIDATQTERGLFYIIDKAAHNTAALVKGNVVQVHYTGKLLDGTIFDTSIEEVAKANGIHNPQRPYTPFEVKVGMGQVIQGWDEGLLLLKKREKARFFIPSGLAYGATARGGVIPANAILLFEVEIVDVCA